MAALCVACSAQPSAPTGCKGTPNPYTPKASNATFIQSVPNGKLYIDYGVTPPMRIVHLWGSAYEMGFATGSLLAADLQVFIPQVMAYFEQTAGDSFPKDTPSWLLNIIEKYGVPLALDWTYEMTKPYTPKHYDDELAGLAAGARINLRELRRLNMIPELIKAACSMVGAWGPAIAESRVGSTLYQLRALDWETKGPFQDYPVVMVYHTEDQTTKQPTYDFATLGWTGFVGALTGYSSANVGICEKYWGGYNGTYIEAGYPFPYVLRDILQFDGDVQTAYERIQEARRTCAIFVGLGDSKTNQFRAVEYSHTYLDIFSDKDYPDYKNHPRMDGLVYIDKHFQPSHDPCLGAALAERYGQVDELGLIYAASMHQTGDTHAAVYDYARNFMYVSSASSASTPPIIPAYNRQFLKLDLTQLWAETKP